MYKCKGPYIINRFSVTMLLHPPRICPAHTGHHLSLPFHPRSDVDQILDILEEVSMYLSWKDANCALTQDMNFT
jgi:hypothetical protein